MQTKVWRNLLVSKLRLRLESENFKGIYIDCEIGSNTNEYIFGRDYYLVCSFEASW